MTSFIIIAVVVLLLLGLVAYWLFGKRSKPQLMVNQQLEEKYKALLTQHIAYYQKLNATDQTKFEGMIASFLQNIRIEGVGLEVDDTDRVLVASSAIIPIFGYEEWRYQNLTNVILYPDTFNNDFQFEGESRNIQGMVGSGYMNGQMLLSRAALLKGFSSQSGKQNTGIHEFVHLLDKSDGATDGLPENMLAHEYASPWLKMMHHEMQRIEKGHSDIDPYAATSEAEFLAVAAEYFFEKPGQLQQKHPELYQQLSRVFAQNPAAK
ncbi:zinc-dependent peptidase [Mucilaginibacter robiniae]|uniref:Zinc-dependent peptidase n=1 Tax=Mucilaginibacter robiniae TaxID=2728022 RepID=A0A7L5DXY8_9SPHI|nr:M90 family metallopeptidase [Mucilaginibacter robiniae]QJD94977.1 zinc-dependent peptidase [Mucilaginibacter robiniae]